MSPDQVQRLQELFREALSLDSNERESFVDQACSDDQEIRSNLIALLAADEKAEREEFMEASPNRWVGALMDTDEVNTESNLIGEVIGPYTLVRKIGQGGMGEVFQAVRHEPFRQYVALKLIRPSVGNEELVQRFRLERQILASMNHPNISRLIDGGSFEIKGLGTRPYLVMEYIEGVPITDYCDRHRLKVDDRLRLFQKVCSAVHYAHQNLVIHRDLKPSNILVTKNGEVKLLDFGVAKLLNPQFLQGEVPITRTGVRAMTPEYASPEQMRGESLTTSSDIYSLGVILYEVLTGRRPYRLAGLTTKEIEELVCEKDPERPSTRVTKEERYTRRNGETETIEPNAVSHKRAVSTDKLRRRLKGDLDNIVLMALRKERTRRYSSVELISLDLDRFLNAKPVQARSSTYRYRMQKFVARHPITFLLSTMAVLFLLAFGATLVVKNAEISLALETANDEKDKAQQITSFVTSLFQVNNPSESMGDTLTARQILGRGLEKIDALENQPKVQRELLHVIGQVHESMGMHKASLPIFERSVRMLREQNPNPSLEFADAINDLAAMYAATTTNMEEAESLYGEALEIRKKHLENDDPVVGNNLLYLGLISHTLGKFDKAESHWMEAVEIYRKLNTESEDAAMAMRELARVYHIKGRFLESDSLFQASIELYRQLFGPAHPELARSLYSYADMLDQKGDLDRAEKYHTEAKSMIRTLHGDDYFLAAHINTGLGDIAAAKKDFDKAEEFYLEAVEYFQEYMPDDIGYTTALLGYSEILRLAKRYEEAEAAVLKAIKMRADRFGGDNAMLVDPHYKLATILEDKGDIQRSEKQFRELLLLCRKSLRPHHPKTGLTLAHLGFVLDRTDHSSEATELFIEAKSILEKNAGHEKMIEKIDSFLDLGNL